MLMYSVFANISTSASCPKSFFIPFTRFSRLTGQCYISYGERTASFNSTLQNSQFTSGDILQASQTFNLPQTPQYSQYVAMNPGSPLFSQIPTPSTPVYTQQNMDIPGMLNMMLQKLTTMDIQLSQLDAIQTSMGLVWIRRSSQQNGK